MSGQNSTPDLAAILANLAQFASPAQAASATPANVDAAGLEQNRIENVVQHLPAPTADPRPRPQGRAAAASPKPMIDPATITTWQEGLRCVTKIAAQNAQFATSIRKMMDEQRRNEMRWYAERQALKQAQSSRSKSSAEALSILQSLTNGAGTISASANGTTDMEAELVDFDRKIYDAQSKMEASMVADMKGLGVPFFGTHQSLLVAEGNAEDLAQGHDDRPKWSPSVTHAQLMSLRRRMIAHLEDLYRD